MKKKETDYTNKIDSLEKKLRENSNGSTKSATSPASPPLFHASSISPQALATEQFNSESLSRTIELLRYFNFFFSFSFYFLIYGRH